jgi:protein ImuB
MAKRFVSIWFPYLTTDWFSNRRPGLRAIPFVLCMPSHGRMVITAANPLAEEQGVFKGMVLADARAIINGLQHIDDKPGLADKLLHRIAEWCIRFTPCAAIDAPDGIILDASGCSQLWGNDEKYLAEIQRRLQLLGYTSRISMADTIGTAWAIARYSNNSFVVKSKLQTEALLNLPVASLRIEAETIDRLNKLGLRKIKDFIVMPRTALRRRFGSLIIQRINQALGTEEEFIQPVQPIEPYHERLPSLEPIVNITGIEIALNRLLEALCKRLRNEAKGLRLASFKCYRIDGKIQQVDIGTLRPSCNENHLFKLFESKLSSIEPDLGIELFILEASKVEDHTPRQEKIWESSCGLDSAALGELLDRIADKNGANTIHRYLPAEHYWPERSYQLASTLNQQLDSVWKLDRPRPLQLLHVPERIEVTAPIPDYPPMNFRYKGKLYTIKKAEGPERIEQEWWLQEGEHRDYYIVEDEDGNRYWLFRLGHYSGDKTHQWYLHGFFS